MRSSKPAAASRRSAPSTGSAISHARRMRSPGWRAKAERGRLERHVRGPIVDAQEVLADLRLEMIFAGLVAVDDRLARQPLEVRGGAGADLAEAIGEAHHRLP